MAQVPKKNISSDITDIRKPKVSGRKVWQWTARPLESSEPVSGESIGRYVAIFIVAVISLVTLVFGATYAASRYMSNRVQSKLDQIQSLVGRDGPKLSPKEMSITDSAQDLWGMLKNAGKIYGMFAEVSGHLFASASALERLQSEWPEILKADGSNNYKEDIAAIQKELAAFASAGTTMQKDDSLRSIVPLDTASYLSLQFDLARTKNFIDALMVWLGSDSERHILVLFTNTSELRPAGGFIGSYGDAVFKSGHLTSFSVHDINEADRTFDRNIIPPKQLQGVVRRWRTADSNWFFDFSESAHKTLEFMEASRMYASTTFDGVVAVTPQVVADILKVTGPVKLANGTEIDADNMLGEFQKQVQDGQADRISNPKAILAEVAPELLKRFQGMSDNSRKTLSSSLFAWGQNKDLMVYFKNGDFEEFFDGLGITGKTAQTEKGDGYLAVATANIGGGKTDAFIRQSIDMDVVIGDDGRVMNKISVDRLHTATSGEPWWYKQTNKSYVMVFAPAGSELAGSEGGKDRNVMPRQSYASFVADEGLRKLELTLHKNVLYPTVDIFQEAGKQVFAAWMDVNPSEEKTLAIRYLNRLAGPPQPGMKYSLFIDKQAGSDSSYTVRFTAPQGLNFKETHSPIFEYRVDNPSARTLITATFEKP